jgi:hypothetical protein
VRKAGRGHIYAVTVGVNEYRCPQIRPLKFAVADAVAVRDALTCRLSVEEDHAILVAGNGNSADGPTKSDILTALARFATPNVRYEDTFVFFFAGRAFESAGKTYLAGADAQIGSDLLLRETTISLTALHGFLEGVPAGQQILVFEASRESPVWTAREPTNGRSLRDTAMLVELRQNMHQPQSRAVVWSSWHGQEAHEYPESGHGWYCWNLLLELNEIGEPGLSIGDLHARVKERMASSAEELLPVASDQQPRIRIVGDVPTLRPAPCATPPSSKAPREGEGGAEVVDPSMFSDNSETKEMQPYLPDVDVSPPGGEQPDEPEEPPQAPSPIVDDPYNPRDKGEILLPRTFTCKVQATVYAILPNGEPDISGRMPGVVKIPRCRTWRVIGGSDVEGVLKACIDEHAAGLQVDKRVSDADVLEIAAAMPWLQELSLTGCASLTEEGVDHVRRLRRLRYLDLSRCGGVTDTSLEAVTMLSRLIELTLAECESVTAKGLEHVGQVPGLQNLVLTGCMGIDDASLVHVAKLRHLRWLSLSGCASVSDAGIRHLASLKELETLELSRLGRINGTGVGALSALPGLQRLWLEGCERVTDDGIAEVAKLAHLTYVNIKGCHRVSNDGLATLATLPGLKMLYVTLGGGIDEKGIQHLRERKPDCVVDGIEQA